MTGAICIPASFYSHPFFDAWRGRARYEMRFMRLMRVLQGNQDSNGGLESVRLTLKQWKACLTGALTSVLDFLREGAACGFWDWDEAEGRLQLATWVWEEPSLPQTSLPLFEETRPPSKQPEAAAAYMRERRAKKREAESPAEVTPAPLQTTTAATPVPTPAPAEAAPVRSETSNNASNISNSPSNTPLDVGNVRNHATAYSLASLAEASLVIHNKAKARALSLAGRVSTNAAYPNNTLSPSETVIHHLLQVGHAAPDLEAAIAKCQDSPTVQKGGGLGEKGWQKWLADKLPTPDAARTPRLDMLVPSETGTGGASSPATGPAAAFAPPAVSPPAPLQNVAYDSAGRAYPISAEAKRTLERSRREQQHVKPLTALTADEQRALRDAGNEREKQAKQARDDARKAG